MKQGIPVKVIITDLDRTLLHSDKRVSGYTADVLRRCRRQGLLIMAATARPLRDVRVYDALIGFDAITATNGAVIVLPEGRMEWGISADSGEKILANLLRFQDVCLSVETDRGLYANRDIPEWQPVVYEDFSRLPEHAVLYKILASSSDGRLYSEVEQALTDDVYHTIAGGDLVQIMSREATKWKGVRHMLASFGIAPQDAVYFGDDNDDMEPIRNCGWGVAVSNAIPPVRAAADALTDSNDADGVARFIEKKILHSEK